MKLIEARNVSKTFPIPGGALEAITDISFSVSGGSLVSIVGVSGCGKTTLLKIIAGLLKPTSGEIFIAGKSPGQAAEKLGYIPQDLALLPWLNVRQNVAFPLELASADKDFQDRKNLAVEKALSLVGLLEFQRCWVNQLSGGMKQRIAIARALVSEPTLLLMDEPFRSLDEINRERLNYELLKIWYELQPTILMVTHSLREAVYMSEQIIVLSSRPAKVVDILDVRLGFPRRPEMEIEPEFKALINKLRLAIG